MNPAKSPLKIKNILLCMLVAPMLGGCASSYSHVDGAVGGALGGAIAGGAIGAVCCGDPVHGLPAGILIGGVAGGITGFIWPSKLDKKADQN